MSGDMWVLPIVFVAAMCLLGLWLTRKRPPTVADEMQKLRDEMHALAVEVGKPLLPPLRSLVEALNKITKS